MHTHSIQEQMLDAIEFFHYSQKYKGQLFTFLLARHEYLREILIDLRVLQSSHINAMFCCRDSKGLTSMLKEWIPRGYQFDYFQAQAPHWEDSVRASLQAERMPVLAFPNGDDKVLPPSRFHQQAFAAALSCNSRKIFFLSRRRGLVVDNVFKSHPSPAEPAEFISGAHKINIGAEALSFFWDAQKSSGSDIVLLEAKRGALFQEVFTHRGAATLFSIHHQDVLRQALLSDVRDISLLMTPYIQSGAVLPVSEDDIALHIKDYHLAVVNGEIVATAKLTDYGEAAEIAKLSTLPRFRGRGRARELVRRMIETARQSGKKQVFALTVEPKVAFFFRGLGFKERARETLPQQWQAGYDFSRTSRAFVLDL